MRKTIFYLFFIISTYVYSQKDILKYNRDYPVFEECEAAEDKKKCFRVRISDFFEKNVSDSLQLELIKESKKDTITVSFQLYFNETGILQFNQSNLFSSVENSDKSLKSVLKKLPQIKPPTDEFDNGVASHLTIILGFEINNFRNKLKYIKDYKPEVVPFAAVDKVPVFNGCEKESDNIALTNCMNNLFQNHIKKNFRGNLLANGLGLKRGIHGIYLFFNITEKGDVEIIKVTAPHPILQNEGKRLIKTLPQAISPAFFNNSPVKIGYTIPVKFKVE